MGDIKNVQLGFSCPFKKEDLHPTSGGYDCESCSKKVIDFTDKSREELDKHLQSGDHVCGTFKSSQLSQTFLKYAAMTALVGSSYWVTAQGPKIVPQDSVEIEEWVTTGEIEMTMGIIATPESNRELFPFVYPTPVGGIQKFYQSLMKELKFPAGLKEDGKVYLRITVDTLGRMQHVEVVKGLELETNQEAVRAVKATGFPFVPGKRGGIAVVSDMIIPVNFRFNLD